MALAISARRSVAGVDNLVVGYHQADASYPTQGYPTTPIGGTQTPGAAQFHSVLGNVGHVFFGGVDSAGRLAVYTLAANLALYTAPGTEVTNATDVSNSYTTFIFLTR